MKLYNLFEDIIFEDRKLINEVVSKEQIEDAIDSRRRIKISYQGGIESKPETRYVDVYALGTSKGNNEVIRVYQPFGYSTKQDATGWKLLRTDRIMKWEPTNFKFSSKSVDKISGDVGKRNPNGDRSISSVSHWNNTPRFNDDSEINNEPIQQVQKNYQPKKQVSSVNKPIKKQDSNNPVVNNTGNNNNNNTTTGTKPSRYED